MLITLDKISLMVLITFLVVVLSMPMIIKIANHIGAIDVPKDDRRVHTKPMPKLGGLGIFLGFIIGYTLFGQHYAEMNAVLIGGFIIILVGLIDDINPIKARYKLAGQVLASLIIVAYGEILLTNVSILSYNLEFNIFSYPLTILFIVAIINCMNIIDGLDGLSGGIASIYYLTVGIISLTLNKLGGLDITIAFIMLGSTLGFLFHNFHPAKVFAGDTGSMFMGYMVAVIALLGFKNVTVTSFVVPVLILAIPLLDTFLAIIRRIVNKKPIAMPDKEHLHHQLLRLSFSQSKTVLIIYFINILFAIASVIYALVSPLYGMMGYGILLILVMIFVFQTNMLINNNKEKRKK